MNVLLWNRRSAVRYGRHSPSRTAANPQTWVVAGALMAAFVAYGRFAVGLHG
jgi:hypothetical protein